MRVQYGKDVASHSGPESCGVAREGAAEALTGETGGSAIKPRNQKSGTPTPLSDAEGKTDQGDKCESWDGPARSENLHTPGSFLHRSWEISAVPGATTPGNFVVPPAKAEEMYMPETFGRSAGDRVVIE